MKVVSNYTKNMIDMNNIEYSIDYAMSHLNQKGYISYQVYLNPETLYKLQEQLGSRCIYTGPGGVLVNQARVNESSNMGQEELKILAFSAPGVLNMWDTIENEFKDARRFGV